MKLYFLPSTSILPDCFEAVNLEQTLTLTVKLSWHFNMFNYTHLCMTSHFCVVMISSFRTIQSVVQITLKPQALQTHILFII